MSIKNLFKDIGTFLSKQICLVTLPEMYTNMPSHVTRNVLDDPKSNEIFCAEFFGPNQKSLSFKMAEIWLIV